MPEHTPGLPYATAGAFEAALNARLKKAAVGTDFTPGELRGHFAYDRLLSRLMAPPSRDGDGQWVLKGGVNLLTRLEHARHTTDVDVAMQGDINALLQRFRREANRDIGDMFTFDVGQVKANIEGAEGRRVTVTARLGRKVFAEFGVDIVASGPPIGTPDVAQPLTPITIEGLPQTPYVLYPLSDMVADKSLAIMQTYPGGKPSSRFHDLVDLVLIARSHRLELAEVRMALDSEQVRRGMTHITEFAVPERDWLVGYAAAASEVSGLGPLGALPAAEQLAKALLDPVFDRSVEAGVWNPDQLAWEIEDLGPAIDRAQHDVLNVDVTMDFDV